MLHAMLCVIVIPVLDTRYPANFKQGYNFLLHCLSVAQVDVHFPEISVRETMNFSARCQGKGPREGLQLTKYTSPLASRQSSI